MLRFLLILFALGSMLMAKAQLPIPSDTSSINQIDKKGWKQGFWMINQEARMGEPAFSQIGFFTDDRKSGTWYNFNFLGDINSIETYSKGVRNGVCTYFEKGIMVLQGTFRGLNPDVKFDTFDVIDPETLEEVQVILPSELGSVMHGTWRYYNPLNGVLIKEEVYQVGNLLSTKNYSYSFKTTKETQAKIEANMPHIKDPTGKKGAKGQRKRWIK